MTKAYKAQDVGGPRAPDPAAPSIGGPGSVRVSLFPSFQKLIRLIGGVEVDVWHSALALVAFRAGGRWLWV